jgi:hypothetical protein
MDSKLKKKPKRKPSMSERLAIEILKYELAEYQQEKEMQQTIHKRQHARGYIA